MAGEQGGAEPQGNEDLPQVIELLTTMLRANSRDTQVLAARGLAYEKLGHHRRAVEDYDAAIRLDPGNAAAHSSRGGCKAELGLDAVPLWGLTP